MNRVGSSRWAIVPGVPGACAAVLLLAGCSGGGGGSPTPTAATETVGAAARAPTETETSGATAALSPVVPTLTPSRPGLQTSTPWLPRRMNYYATGHRSGIAAIDEVLRLVETRNAEELIARIAYSILPCSRTFVGIGGPPACPDGQPEGSPVQAFPGRLCSAGYMQREDAERWLRQALAERWRLAAAWVPTAVPPERLGDGVAFVVVFGRNEDQPHGLFELDVREDGRVSGFDYCPPGSMASNLVREFVIAPLAASPP